MMLHRYLLSHTYDQKKFREVLEAVKFKYLVAFAGLESWFSGKAEDK